MKQLTQQLISPAMLGTAYHTLPISVWSIECADAGSEFNRKGNNRDL